MSDKNNIMDVIEFKERLRSSRKKRQLSQEELTEILNFSYRSKITNWENPKTQTLPSLYDFYSLCKILDCDPNYMLGYSELDCSKDGAASEYTHLSIEAIEILRKDNFVPLIMNALITSEKSSILFNKIFQRCYHGYLSSTPESIFSPDAFFRLELAFEDLCNNENALHLTPTDFIPYVMKAFPWDNNKTSFNEFLESIIISTKYHEMVINNEDFKNHSDKERYNCLMYDVATSSFGYLLTSLNSRLLENEITDIIKDIILNFMHSNIAEFKQQHIHKF